MTPNQYIPEGSYLRTSNIITVTIMAQCQKADGTWVDSAPLSYSTVQALQIADIMNDDGVLSIRQGDGTVPNPTHELGPYVPAGSYQNKSKAISITINAFCIQNNATWIQSPPLSYNAESAGLISDLSNTNGCLDFKVPTISTKGKAFVLNGKRFILNGLALSANTSVHQTADVLADLNYDYMHKVVVPGLVALHVNTIRVYYVDPMLQHDRVMRLLAMNGIYVMLGLTTTDQSVNRMDPSYSWSMYQRGISVIDAFQAYSNTLAFSVGNELIFPGEMDLQLSDVLPISLALEKTNAAVLKSFIRDMKSYALSKKYRAIPVGVALHNKASSSVPNLVLFQSDVVAEFYASGETELRADFIAIDSYRCMNGSPNKTNDEFTRKGKSLPVPEILTASDRLTIPSSPSGMRENVSSDFSPSERYDQLIDQHTFRFFEKETYLVLFNHYAVGPPSEALWGNKAARVVKFLSCKQLILPLLPDTIPINAPSDFSPHLVPNPAFDSALTENKNTIDDPEALNARGAFAKQSKASSNNSSSVHVRISRWLESYMLAPSNN
ncbi:MAG: hypothetical protein ACERKD_06535 [Prolixibacteraceae bacterium]